MTKEELSQLVKDAVADQVKTLAKPAEPEVKPDVLAAAEVEVQKDLEGKFKTFGGYLSAVRNIRQFGHPDSRLTFMDSKGMPSKPFVNVQGKATLVEGTDSAGGFLVPEEFRAQIFAEGLETAVVRPNGPFVVPMGSDVISFPSVNDTTHTSTVFGGVVGYWQGEGGTYQESEPVFGNIKLTAKKLMGFTKVSDELMQDSAIALDPFLRRSFAEAWAYFEDLAWLRGTGSGQPLGILNAPALVSVTRQDTDNVLFRDIVNIWSRVSPAYRSRAVWIANQEVLPELLFMNAANTTTNAYGSQILFISNVQGTPSMSIFGRPLILTEKLSALGDAGDIGCFDLGNYIIGERQGLTIDMSNQVYWGTGYIAFKFTERVDGQPIPGSYLTPYKGSATISPFVTLSATS
jgi:HK97 family phage major capsid protein